jgi:hypothetical protein
MARESSEEGWRQTQLIQAVGVLGVSKRQREACDLRLPWVSGLSGRRDRSALGMTGEESP